MALSVEIKETRVRIGDNVKVMTMYKDGEKLKKQAFIGKVIAIKNAGANTSFTVRRVTESGIGVERIFPVSWPLLEGVVVTSHDKIRRSKLYYIRGRIGKAAQIA